MVGTFVCSDLTDALANNNIAIDVFLAANNLQPTTTSARSAQRGKNTQNRTTDPTLTSELNSNVYISRYDSVS